MGALMKNKPSAHIITVGLAIFSMFFGAGNLMFPLEVGLSSGSYTAYGMIGFILTAVLLPLTGLIAMILFDGNYHEFFNRLGAPIGKTAIFICMMIIGPMIAIPRIVTVSHTMIAPFLPFSFLTTITTQSSFIFAILFLILTYIATYRENRIVDLLGYFISPALLASLFIIIAKGYLTAETVVTTTTVPWTAFKTNFVRGYETLDLLGGIFFSSIVIHILKNNVGGMVGYNRNKLAFIGLKAGAFGVSLLAFVYIGLGLLGMYHGHGLSVSGDLFRDLAFRVLGNHGALIIATAVLMACFSTAIALGAVVSEYFQITIFKKKISFEAALAFVFILCLPLSTFGLDMVRALTGGPIVYIGYPAIITLTFCNIAYKLFNFTPVKTPVAITFVIALISYFF